jgi:hypothetical protein
MLAPSIVKFSSWGQLEKYAAGMVPERRVFDTSKALRRVQEP